MTLNMRKKQSPAPAGSLTTFDKAAILSVENFSFPSWIKCLLCSE